MSGLQTGLQAHIGLQLLREFVASTGDEEAKAYFNALVMRLQAIQAEEQRQATTTIDENGNIVIGLKSLGMTAQMVPMQ